MRSPRPTECPTQRRRYKQPLQPSSRQTNIIQFTDIHIHRVAPVPTQNVNVSDISRQAPRRIFHLAELVLRRLSDTDVVLVACRQFGWKGELLPITAIRSVPLFSRARPALTAPVTVPPMENEEPPLSSLQAVNAYEKIMAIRLARQRTFVVNSSSVFIVTGVSQSFRDRIIPQDVVWHCAILSSKCS